MSWTAIQVLTLALASWVACSESSLPTQPTPGLVPPPADAAAAQAAHDVLVAMFPSLQQVYDAALATQLSRIPSTAAQAGSRVGADAARAILNLRAHDGWNRPAPDYMLPNLPGY